MALVNPSERYESRQVTIDRNGVSTIEVFRVDGPDQYDVIGDVDPIGSSHPTIPNCYLETVGIKRFEGADPQTGEPDVYSLVTYNYKPPSRDGTPNANGEIWVWDITSQSVHIDSVEKGGDQLTFDVGNPSGTEYYTTLGQDGDNIKGADVFRPAGSLRVTKYFPLATVDQAFRQTLYGLQNTLNDGAWQDWTKYEVLFLGSTINYDTNTGEATVVYNFRFGETQTDVKVDVFQSNPSLLGSPPESTALTEVTLKSPMDGGNDIYPFDYISSKVVQKKLKKSAGNPKSVRAVTASEYVGVAKVYPIGDFSGLGLVGP